MRFLWCWQMYEWSACNEERRGGGRRKRCRREGQHGEGAAFDRGQGAGAPHRAPWPTRRKLREGRRRRATQSGRGSVSKKKGRRREEKEEGGKRNSCFASP